MRVHPEHLLSFVAVAECGNISRAAARLNLSQPAVSAQMRGLQSWFGAPLYHRHGQGVTLTAAGEAVLEQARRLRACVDQAQAMRDAYRGMETGVLRLGASTTLASYLLPQQVAQYREAFPGIALSLSDGNTAEIVARLAMFDLAFVEGEIAADLPADARALPWQGDEVVAIVQAGHPMAGLPHADLATIVTYPWVSREPGSGLRHLVESTFERAGLAPRAALELAGVEAVKHAVRAGLGVGFVSSLAMRFEAPGLVSVRIGAGLFRQFAILVTHADAPSRATRHFLERLRLGPQGTN